MSAAARPDEPVQRRDGDTPRPIAASAVRAAWALAVGCAVAAAVLGSGRARDASPSGTLSFGGEADRSEISGWKPLLGGLLGCMVAAGVVVAMIVSWRTEIDLQGKTRATAFTAATDVVEVALPGCADVSKSCPMLAGEAMPESPAYTLRFNPRVRVEVTSSGRSVTFRPVADGTTTSDGGVGPAGMIDRSVAAYDRQLGVEVYETTPQPFPLGAAFTLPDVGTLVGKSDFISIALPARLRFELGARTRKTPEPATPMLLDGKAQFSARMRMPFLADPPFVVQEQPFYPGDFAALDTASDGASAQPLSGLIRIDADGVLNIRVRGLASIMRYESYGGGLSGSSTVVSTSLMSVVLAHPLSKLFLGALAGLSALWGIPKFFGKGKG